MPQALRYRTIWLSLGLLMLTVVMAIALWPIPDPPAFLHSDKILHAITFAFLMLWFAGLWERSNWLPLFLFLLAYGGVIEILQSFSTYRFMSAGDVIANLMGLFIGWGAAFSGFDRWAVWLEDQIS